MWNYSTVSDYKGLLKGQVFYSQSIKFNLDSFRRLSSSQHQFARLKALLERSKDDLKPLQMPSSNKSVCIISELTKAHSGCAKSSSLGGPQSAKPAPHGLDEAMTVHGEDLTQIRPPFRD